LASTLFESAPRLKKAPVWDVEGYEVLFQTLASAGASVLALGYRDTAGIRLFLENHPTTAGGLIVYGGQQVKRMDEKIVAIPWSFITG